MTPRMKSAWLISEGTTYLASVPVDAGRSAIVELIERIYHSESTRTESTRSVSRAHVLLREWIHSDALATPADREAVKVTAKRLRSQGTAPVPAGDDVILLAEAPPLPEFALAGVKRGQILSHAEVARHLEALKTRTVQTDARWASDRAVAAILVDSTGGFLAAAWNTNAVIRTRHAERNLCESLAAITVDGKIPLGAVLYVSLKPCRMCAARIWEVAADPARLSVIYFEEDSGPFAQGTMLEANSPARLRYLGPRDPRLAVEISRLEAILSDQA